MAGPPTCRMSSQRRTAGTSKGCSNVARWIPKRRRNDGQPIKPAPFNYFVDASGANDPLFNFPSSQLSGGSSASALRPVPTRSPSTLSRFALVFLDSQDPIDPIESAQTWPTSIATELSGTAVVGPSVLATSNRRGGAQEAFNLGGTNFGSQVYSADAQRRVFTNGSLVGIAMIVSAWAVLAR
ncbi:hypothetical protein FRC01_013638 [Tulasnella sp. 417]|nr:hypothetical protein FRC01_013638 [Tulasnella sp. 417]